MQAAKITRMQTLDDYDYQLPKDRIAQKPTEKKESAKLLIVTRKTQSFVDASIASLLSILSASDVLVVNNTKVFKARLFGKNQRTKKEVEIFLVRPLKTTWIALAKPGKKNFVGDTIQFGADFICVITAKYDDGTIAVSFSLSADEVINKTSIYGHVPNPPYILNEPNEAEYQTVFAKHTGSVAAPTAGLHLSETMLEALRTKGIEIIEITLHVGLGTFMPVKTTFIEQHHMHDEWVNISNTAALSLQHAIASKKRIVAVGTTTVRALEGVANLFDGKVQQYTGNINIFIKPPYKFFIVDAMLTNFHLPKSTLLMLVSAFAELSFIKKSYEYAIMNDYRFFSFGDAMFIQ